MKKVFFILSLAILASLASGRVLAQDFYYVVVGTFEYESNAEGWLKVAEANGLDAKFASLDKEYFNYVYVYQSLSLQDAIVEYERVRAMPDFPDTWVLKAGPVSDDGIMAAGPEPEQDAEEIVEVADDVVDDGEEVVEAIVDDEDPKEPITYVDDSAPAADGGSDVDLGLIPPVQIGKYIPEGPATASIQESPAYIPEMAELEIPGVRINDDPTAIEPDLGEPRPGYTMFKVYFNAVNGRNLEDVATDIEVINIFEANLITTIPSHTLSGLQLGNGADKQVMLVCNPVGYRRMEHTVDLEDPFADNIYNYVKRHGDSIVVDFRLMRLRKGDIDVLFNVYFWNDAAIMRPQSQYEVDQILEMLRENPSMKIRIHGHTNGNAYGKIIKAPADSEEWFNVTENSIETMGSAKELSEQRAMAIMNYLVGNGIDPDRLEVEGWGGKRPIYDEDSDLAKKNVRVEIEVIED